MKQIQVLNFVRALCGTYKWLAISRARKDLNSPAANHHLKWMAEQIGAGKVQGFDLGYYAGFIEGALIGKFNLNPRDAKRIKKEKFRSKIETYVGRNSELDDIMEEYNYYRPKPDDLIKRNKKTWAERRRSQKSR